MKCLYHHDPDGKCAATHVKQNTPDCTPDDFFECNYDKPLPDMSRWFGEFIYIVDFSIPVELMKELHERNNIVIWIDHHETAIEKYKDYPEAIEGVRIVGIAGCMLTWLYFNRYDVITAAELNKDMVIDCIYEQAPLYTRYIHLWDTWQWKDNDRSDNIKLFVIALEAEENDPFAGIWYDLFDFPDAFIYEMVEHGANMLKFRDAYSKNVCDEIGEVIEFEGYRCYVCNIPKSNSEWFNSISKDTYDIIIPYYYNNKTKLWVASLYTLKDIDVSKIAVKYGGGGHHSAAGFQVKELPFVINETEAKLKALLYALYELGITEWSGYKDAIGYYKSSDFPDHAIPGYIE